MNDLFTPAHPVYPSSALTYLPVGLWQKAVAARDEAQPDGPAARELWHSAARCRAATAERLYLIARYEPFRGWPLEPIDKLYTPLYN